MKELSIKDKARRYDEALKEAVFAHKDEDKHLKATLERIFPALKESEDEDEKTRKFIIEIFKSARRDGMSEIIKHEEFEKIFAWLEKQSKASKVEEAMRDIEQKAKAFTEANEGLTSDEILAQMRGFEC